MITQISAREVLATIREQLGTPPSPCADAEIDNTLLSALLRRAAGIHCPCSLSTLVSAVMESLQYLAESGGVLEERVNAAAEGLVIIGDLLELHQVTVDDPNAKSTWVFAAPPGFIVRPGGSIFLIGIVPDETSPLPRSLNSRVEHDGPARILVPGESENLVTVLRELGLREISASAWLKGPKTITAVELRDNMVRRLSELPPSGAIPELSILSSALAVDYYSGRWIAPGTASGEFVARRPQAYGAALWGFAFLADGSVNKFLDFPLKGSRWRGCDTAWHLQMAIDSCRGTPQKYRRRAGTGGGYLDFFSPIPQWIHRRLCIVGRTAPREHCLFSYWLPEREIASEEDHIRKSLWLTATGS